MKKLKWIVGICVLVLVAAVAALWLWLDAIIKTTVETVGPRILGVPVTLGDAAGAAAKTVGNAATEGARTVEEGVDRAIGGLGRLLPGQGDHEKE